MRIKFSVDPDRVCISRTATTSTPLAASSFEAGLLVSRETARIANSLESFLSERTVWMTEPPCLPVAPKTVRTFDILVNSLLEALKLELCMILMRGMNL